MQNLLAVVAAAALLLTTVACAAAAEPWPAERARQWYARQPWLVGCNYVTSTAVNTTEMWQAETFDLATIDRELALAEGLGFNTVRVYLPFIVWEHDPPGLMTRIDRFLGVAARHGIRVMVCLFDDCAFAGKQPYLGPQDAPVPGVHNSGWTPSPGSRLVTDPAALPRLERYVRGVVGALARDDRVVVWDLYNEPGNERMGNKSLPLLEAAFAWARQAQPVQPLTTGIWNAGLKDLNARTLDLSDVVSFHNYGDLGGVKRQVADLAARGRPVLCTEWMRRAGGSRFASHLPFFKQQRVGCWNWGLVNGKTQTHFPWGSPKGAPEPKEPFHDIFRRDGTPYFADEIDVIRQVTGAAGK